MNDPRKTVEAVYERWNRNDGDLALDLFHPEVEIHQMARVFDSAGDFKGQAGLVKVSEELGDAFESIIWSPERWTEAGDSLVVWLGATGKGASSGIETANKLAHMWRVEDGLVTVFHVYETEEEALEAAS